MLWYGYLPDWRILILPLFIAAGVRRRPGRGLWLAALNVKYRDFRYIVPFIVQFGLYISPVGFTSSIVPEHWRLLYSLNPMVGVIDGFRWALLGGEAALYWPGFLLVSSLVDPAAVTGGVRYFRRTERTFADIMLKPTRVNRMTAVIEVEQSGQATTVIGHQPGGAIPPCATCSQNAPKPAGRARATVCAGHGPRTIRPTRILGAAGRLL